VNSLVNDVTLPGRKWNNLPITNLAHTFYFGKQLIHALFNAAGLDVAVK
jgi:hypothetical protein